MGRWAEKHGLDRDFVIQVSHGRRTIDSIREAAPHLDGHHRCYREFDHVEVAERPGYNELGDPRAVETEREGTPWNR
jgi:hypothetical protein